MTVVYGRVDFFSLQNSHTIIIVLWLEFSAIYTCLSCVDSLYLLVASQHSFDQSATVSSKVSNNAGKRNETVGPHDRALHQKKLKQSTHEHNNK